MILNNPKHFFYFITLIMLNVVCWIFAWLDEDGLILSEVLILISLIFLSYLFFIVAVRNKEGILKESFNPGVLKQKSLFEKVFAR